MHPLPRPPRAEGALRAWLSDAAAVLLPVVCAGCGRPDAAVCPPCRVALHPVLAEVRAGPLRVHVALPYSGVPAAVLGAVKEQGRTDALRALAPAMRAVLAAAHHAVLSLPAREPLLVVTMPSAVDVTRRRGFRPVDALVRAAGHRVPRTPVLRFARAVADQAGLTADDRRSNLEGAMRASEPFDGRRVLLVDDVLTTGSTVLEGYRAVLAAGGDVVGAACLAHTGKRKATGRQLVGDSSGRRY